MVDSNDPSLGWQRQDVWLPVQAAGVHTLEFRATGLANTYGGFIEDVMFTGTSSSNPVPEPTAMLVWSILAGSGCGLAAIRRRRGWSRKNRQQIKQIFQG